MDPTFASEEFLAHSAWIRRLARRLLDDEADADDLTQEAWMVLQRQPAGRVRDLRAWLAGVVHRIARRTRHDRTRHDHTRHENTARGATDPARGVEPAVPSPEQVLETEATRRLVVDAVLSLEEPYRAALLLHFYEELAPADIAVRLGVPGSTVRTRIQRGLARVREKLGARDPRDGGGVRAVLVLLADGTRPPATPIGNGILVASSTSKLAGAGIAVALLGLGLWWIASDRPAAPADSSETAAIALVPPTSDGGATGRVDELAVAPTDADRVGLAAPTAPADDRWHLAIARSIGGVRGTVVRDDDGLPAPGAEVRLTTTTGYVAHRVELVDERAPLERTTTTDASGRFAFDGLPTGAYRLEVTAPGDLEATETVTALEVPAPVLVTIKSTSERASPVEFLPVRALDESGRPLPGLEVELTYRGRARGDVRATRVTDADGNALWEGLDLRLGVVSATTADGRVARAVIDPSRFGHGEWKRARELGGPDEPYQELVLRAPGVIAGRIEGGAGAQVHAWLRVRASQAFGPPYPRSATCSADGSFSIAPLAEGTYQVTLEAPPGLCTNEKSSRVVEVAAGATTTIDVRLEPTGIVRGRVVRDADGTPVAGALVRAWNTRPRIPDSGGVKHAGGYWWPLSWTTPFDEGNPARQREVRTDADGRYQIGDLSSRDASALEILSAGLTRALVDPLTIEPGKTVELEHRLHAAGGIQGIAWQYANIGFQREDAECCADVVNMPLSQSATFTVTGLAAGRYAIRALHWSQDDRWAPLGHVDVRAGEITWIDLRDAAPDVARGTLSFRGLPVADASIDLREESADQFLRAITDASGSFEFRRPFARDTAATLDVVAPGVPDAGRVRFEVNDFPGPGVLALELPEGELEVEVVDAGGRALRATVALVPMPKGDPTQAKLDAFLKSNEAAVLDRRAAASGTAIARPTVHAWRAVPSKARRSTDAAGRALFRALPAASMLASVETDAGWSFPPTIVEVPESGRANVVLRAPETGSLRVRVVDADGRALPSLVVNVETTAHKLDFARVLPRATDAHGEVVFQTIAVGPTRVLVMTREEDFMKRRGGTLDVVIASGTETAGTLTIE